jgi:hypothetical protein
MALQILKKAQAALEGAKARLEEASKAMETSAGADQEAIAKLELARDQQLRKLQDEDKHYRQANLPPDEPSPCLPEQTQFHGP